MNYPHVIGEWQTLEAIVCGRSIARYGDGEFKMADRPGVGIKSQEPDAKLSERLRAILAEPVGDCLIGIPNINEVQTNPISNGKKVHFWTKHVRFAALLNHKKLYASSFITRPDSAPWIARDGYWDLLESLWRDKDITLVTGSGKSLKTADLLSAREVREIQAPRQHAWKDYQSLMDRVGTPSHTVIICLGPTATVMAYDLCRKGVHAVDLGHVALFLRKYYNGETVTEVTDEDRAMI